MGSPWPWSQDSVKAAPTTLQNNNSHHLNNNNKRLSYDNENYSYYNHHYNEFHPNFQLPSHSAIQRFISSPAMVGEQLLANDGVRKRTYPPYLCYERNGNQAANNNNVVSRKESASQSQFATCVKEIPAWNIYYSDQKHRIIDFSDKNNSIRPDLFINQLVSLCFVDTCIANLAVDAIVNSTTPDYCGATGVDKLIHQEAGRNLREACKLLPRLGPGQAEMSLGFALPAQNIIHTNGPLTEDAEQLTGCYVNSFNLLLMHRLRTIAFPCISTGRKGLSKKFAAEVALRTVRHFLEEHKQEVDRVIFCLHNQKDIEIYLRYMQIYFPVVGPELHITS